MLHNTYTACLVQFYNYIIVQVKFYFHFQNFFYVQNELILISINKILARNTDCVLKHFDQRLQC
jgi:hypothetical protein